MADFLVIEGEKYKLTELLGQGNNFNAYRAIDQQDFSHVIIKELLPGCSYERVLNQLIQFNKNLSDENLNDISSIQIKTDKKRLYLIQQDEPGIVLSDYVPECLLDVVHLGCELIHIAEKFHRQNLLVLDIKEDNFKLIDKKKYILHMIDFDSLALKNQIDEIKVTTQYMSPLLQKLQLYSAYQNAVVSLKEDEKERLANKIKKIDQDFIDEVEYAEFKMMDLMSQVSEKEDSYAIGITLENFLGKVKEKITNKIDLQCLAKLKKVIKKLKQGADQQENMDQLVLFMDTNKMLKESTGMDIYELIKGLSGGNPIIEKLVEENFEKMNNEQVKLFRMIEEHYKELENLRVRTDSSDEIKVIFDEAFDLLKRLEMVSENNSFLKFYLSYRTASFDFDAGFYYKDLKDYKSSVESFARAKEVYVQIDETYQLEQQNTLLTAWDYNSYGMSYWGMSMYGKGILDENQLKEAASLAVKYCQKAVDVIDDIAISDLDNSTIKQLYSMYYKNLGSAIEVDMQRNGRTFTKENFVKLFDIYTKAIQANPGRNPKYYHTLLSAIDKRINQCLNETGNTNILVNDKTSSADFDQLWAAYPKCKEEIDDLLNKMNTSLAQLDEVDGEGQSNSYLIFRVFYLRDMLKVDSTLVDKDELVMLKMLIKKHKGLNWLINIINILC